MVSPKVGWGEISLCGSLWCGVALEILGGSVQTGRLLLTLTSVCQRDKLRKLLSNTRTEGGALLSVCLLRANVMQKGSCWAQGSHLLEK